MPQPLMAQRRTFVLVHVLFSTRFQKPWLHDAIRPDLYGTLSDLVHAQGQSCLAVGGTMDHVHLALCLAENMRLDRLIARVKFGSLRWLQDTTNDFWEMAWQKGYLAFSVSPADRLALVTYLQTQDKVHARASFKDEARGFLNKYNMGFDERYVWK